MEKEYRGGSAEPRLCPGSMDRKHGCSIIAFDRDCSFVSSIPSYAEQISGPLLCCNGSYAAQRRNHCDEEIITTFRSIEYEIELKVMVSLENLSHYGETEWFLKEVNCTEISPRSCFTGCGRLSRASRRKMTVGIYGAVKVSSSVSQARLPFFPFLSFYRSYVNTFAAYIYVDRIAPNYSSKFLESRNSIIIPPTFLLLLIQRPSLLQPHSGCFSFKRDF